MDKAWREFQRWCRGKHLPALPANPWTVAAYIRYKDRHGGGPAVADALRAIGHAHVLRSAKSPHTHPLVERTLRRLAERAQTAPAQSALFDEAVIGVPIEPRLTETIAPEESDDEAEVKESSETVEKQPSQSARLSRSMRSAPKLVSRRPRRPSLE